MFVDTANGGAVRADPTHWAFPNVDPHIDLWREPVPGWVGFDTQVAFGAHRARTDLLGAPRHRGPGRTGQQMLTVRPFPRPDLVNRPAYPARNCCQASLIRWA